MQPGTARGPSAPCGDPRGRRGVADVTAQPVGRAFCTDAVMCTSCTVAAVVSTCVIRFGQALTNGELATTDSLPKNFVDNTRRSAIFVVIRLDS